MTVVGGICKVALEVIFLLMALYKLTCQVALSCLELISDVKPTYLT